MKALVSWGRGLKAIVDRPLPQIVAGQDAIVAMSFTSISQTDLQTLHEILPGPATGRVLGHEGVGIIHAIGRDVRRLRPGQRVLVTPVSKCGICGPCRQGMATHCAAGGRLLGIRIDGTQAEYVRIPLADASLHVVEPTDDEESLVMLSDLFPTAFECGIQAGNVAPGHGLAVIGCDAVGLASLMLAQRSVPLAILAADRHAYRLQWARQLAGPPAFVARLDAARKQGGIAFGRHGADTVIVTTGRSEDLCLAQDLVAPGGTIALAGILPRASGPGPGKVASRNAAVVSRMPDCTSIPSLLRAVRDGCLTPSILISHRFGIERLFDAYETVVAAEETHAVKVLITMR